jgi:hypothetical protein
MIGKKPPNSQLIHGEGKKGPHHTFNILIFLEDCQGIGFSLICLVMLLDEKPSILKHLVPLRIKVAVALLLAFITALSPGFVQSKLENPSQIPVLPEEGKSWIAFLLFHSFQGLLKEIAAVSPAVE